jgi:hypothetical protein
MGTGTEKRRYPRAKVAWPIVMMTTTGAVELETENISLVGTLVRCPEVLDLDETFRVVIKPSERQLLFATAKKVWSDTFIDDKSMFHGMGVCFTYIFEDDRYALSHMISGHLSSE